MQVKFIGQAAMVVNGAKPSKVKVRPLKDGELTKEETKPAAKVTRQLLRTYGMAEVIARLAKRYPSMPRRTLRALARMLHKEAWDGRDEVAIAKLKELTGAN